MALDVASIRDLFPALGRSDEGTPVAWLDGPAGTQVPLPVIDATTDLLSSGVANLGGHFPGSRDAAQITDAARRAAADLFGGSPDEIVFGHNMTTLTFAVSRAVAQGWVAGDRVVVTSLDHAANVTPWTRAAAESGVEVVTVEFDSSTGLLDPEAVVAAIDDRTRLVAVTAASNALGSVTELAPIVAAARRVGALSYVDAVHHSAHRLSNVAELEPDFLVASAYKFFGPHLGVLYGRSDALDALPAYKVAPAPDAAPDRWETGTQPFEQLVAFTAAVDYLASLGDGSLRRERLESAFDQIAEHETGLATRFMAGLAEIPRIDLYGPQAAGNDRVSTFAISVDGMEPAGVAAELGDRGIYVWDGHYYAVGVMRQLGLLDEGGLVRIGFVHYTTTAEVDRVLDALAGLAARSD